MEQTDTDKLAALLPELTRRARALTRHRANADDLVQETFVAVLGRLRAGAEIANIPAYAAVTLRHARKAPPDETPLDDDRADIDRTLPPLALSEVLRAMERLPPGHAALLLGCAAGDSYADLARRHALPVGTVMSRLSRARARLRGELGLAEHEMPMSP